MDGRWKRMLVGALLAGTVGCTWRPLTPTNPATPPAPPPPTQPTKNSVFVQEPTEDEEVKTGPVGPTLKLLYANTCIESLAKDPNRPAADRERTLTQCRELYTEVLTADPKHLEALMGIGEMYQLTGERERLLEIMGRIVKQHPNDAKAWGWIAVKHGQAKNWTAAVEAYTRASTLDPDNRQYRIHLGFTLARAGRYDEGYMWLGKAMREAEARYNLAMMMLHNGEMERARGELQRCLSIDPNFSPAVDKLASLGAGNPTPATPTVADIKGVGFEELAPVQLNHRR